MRERRSRAEECTTTIEPDISKPPQTRNKTIGEKTYSVWLELSLTNKKNDKKPTPRWKTE